MCVCRTGPALDGTQRSCSFPLHHQKAVVIRLSLRFYHSLRSTPAEQGKLVTLTEADSPSLPLSVSAAHTLHLSTHCSVSVCFSVSGYYVASFFMPPL